MQICSLLFAFALPLSLFGQVEIQIRVTGAKVTEAGIYKAQVLTADTNAAVVKHPPIKNPVTGKTETKDTYELRSWIGKTYTSNSLDEESDLVPGQWTFEVWHEGKKLCEQSFLVVPDANHKDSRKPAAER